MHEPEANKRIDGSRMRQAPTGGIKSDGNLKLHKNIRETREVKKKTKWTRHELGDSRIYLRDASLSSETVYLKRNYLQEEIEKIYFGASQLDSWVGYEFLKALAPIGASAIRNGKTCTKFWRFYSDWGGRLFIQGWWAWFAFIECLSNSFFKGYIILIFWGSSCSTSWAFFLDFFRSIANWGNIEGSLKVPRDPKNILSQR